MTPASFDVADEDVVVVLVLDDVLDGETSAAVETFFALTGFIVVKFPARLDRVQDNVGCADLAQRVVQLLPRLHRDHVLLDQELKQPQQGYVWVC